MDHDNLTSKESSGNLMWAQGRYSNIYFGGIFFLLTLTSPVGGVTALAIQYLLKDRLQATPLEMAVFGACVSLPIYLGFLLGGLYDAWHARYVSRYWPLAAGAPLSAVCYLVLGVGENTYRGLLLMAFLIVLGLTVVSVMAQAMMTTIARDQGVAGGLSAIWNVANSTATVISFMLGGWLTLRASSTEIFAIGAVLAGLVVIFQFSISFVDDLPTNQRQADPTGSPRGHIARHRPLWLALAIIFLFSFSPGWQTPLFYQLTRVVKISSEEYGLFLALLAAFEIPGAVLFGLASRRVSLRLLLWLGTVLVIFQAPLPLLIAGPENVRPVAVLAALLFGIGGGAYWALVMRACPVGREGTGFMLAFSIANVANRLGDLVGSWLYTVGGLHLAMAVNTITSILILPILAILPTATIFARDPGPPMDR